MQNWLLLWIASPSLVAWSAAMRNMNCTYQYQDVNASLNAVDVIATILFLGALVIETVADNQQYNFQMAKGLQKQPREHFCQKGLFSIVRKPNYAAEQFIWFSYYLVSAAAVSKKWSWSGGGCLSLCILFQGSSWLTEQITVRKYPEYIEYQRVVPLYVPNLLATNSRHKVVSKGA
jgi:steroid 5-alpha reductase family enzyme